MLWSKRCNESWRTDAGGGVCSCRGILCRIYARVSKIQSLGPMSIGLGLPISVRCLVLGAPHLILRPHPLRQLVPVPGILVLLSPPPMRWS